MAKNEHGRPFATSGDSNCSRAVIAHWAFPMLSHRTRVLVFIFFLDKTFDGHFIPSWSDRLPVPREQAGLPKTVNIFSPVAVVIFVCSYVFHEHAVAFTNRFMLSM